MSRSRFRALSLSTLLLASAHAAAVAAQEQGADPAPIESARLALDIGSPTAARVEAHFRLRAPALRVLVVRRPGQELEDVVVTIDGQQPVVSPLQRGQVVDVLELGAVRREVTVAYRVRSADAPFRYPLPVPEGALVTGGSVDVRVVLPEGAFFGGDSFPRLDTRGRSSGREVLVGAVSAAPSVAHVVFGSTVPWIGRHRLIELLAILVGALVPGLAALRWWRAQRRR